MPYAFNPFTGNLDYYVSDHTALSNIGTNTHAQIDTHIALSNLNAHGATATADLDFAQYQSKNMAEDNGATLPTSPVLGQRKLHTPTGRQVSLVYNGTSWVAALALSSVTVYADPTGTDSADKGYGTGTNAFATIPYALSQIPPLNAGNVVISVAAGTYSANLDVQGKYFTGPYTLTFQGVYSNQRTSTSVSSATAGSSTANATLTVNGASMTTDQYKGMILKFASNTTTAALRDTEHLIKTNNNAVNSVITIVGAWVAGFGTTPVAGDTFTIEQAGTIISGAITVLGGQKGIVFDKIKSTTAFIVKETSNAVISKCDCSSSTTTTVSSASRSFLGISLSYIHGSGNARRLYAPLGDIELSGVLINGVGLTTTHTVDIYLGSIVANGRTNVIESNTGTGYGAWIRSNGIFGLWVNTGQHTKNQVDGNTTGLRAETGGQGNFCSTAYVIFTGNTTDTSVDATTYGSIT